MTYCGVCGGHELDDISSADLCNCQKVNAGYIIKMNVEAQKLLLRGWWKAVNYSGDEMWISPSTLGWGMSLQVAIDYQNEMDWANED